MRIVKIVLTLAIVLGLIITGAFQYIKGVRTVDTVSQTVQKNSSLMTAVDQLETFKESDKIKYNFKRQYQLPEKTLWEISIEKNGAVSTCNILEERERIDFQVKTDEYDTTIKLLQDNNIEYTVIQSEG